MHQFSWDNICVHGGTCARIGTKCFTDKRKHRPTETSALRAETNNCSSFIIQGLTGHSPSKCRNAECPPWKKFICMWQRKLLISVQSERWVCVLTVQPSAGGIFVCPSRRLFVSTSFVYSACILFVLICICPAGCISLVSCI